MQRRTRWPVVALAAALAGGAEARVKLVALPDRGATVVRAAGHGKALVEEERVLTLNRGTNQVDFSWKSVRIDVATLRLSPLDHPDQVRIVRMTIPPGESSLVWQVHADQAYQERVRISYLLDGVGREVSYRATVAQDEQSLGLKAYLQVDNQSGEDYEDATLAAGYGLAARRRLRHGESRKILALSAPRLPVEKVYLWDASEKPHDPEASASTVGVPVHYLIRNTEAAGLGRFSLERGKLRLFQVDAQGTEAFLGEDWATHTPPGQVLKVHVGDSRDVSVTRKVKKRERVNERRNQRRRVVLYDRRELVEYTLKNFRDQPARLVLVEHPEGEWEIPEASSTWTREHAREVRFELDLPPSKVDGDRVQATTLSFELVTRNLRR